MGNPVVERQILFVPADVRERTLCSSGFSCLKEGRCMGRPVCTGLVSLGHRGVCVLEGVSSCPYLVKSDGLPICDCPTRVALFVRYQI